MKTMKTKNTYSTKRFVFDPDKDNPKFWVRNYVTVSKNLTWQEAKKERSEDHKLQIVRE